MSGSWNAWCRKSLLEDEPFALVADVQQAPGDVGIIEPSDHDRFHAQHVAVRPPHPEVDRSPGIGTELGLLQHGMDVVSVTLVQELADVVTEDVFHLPTQHLFDGAALERHPAVAVEHGDEVGRFRHQRREPPLALLQRRLLHLAGDEAATRPLGTPDHQHEEEATEDQRQDGAVLPPQLSGLGPLAKRDPGGVEVLLDDIERRNELDGTDVGGPPGICGSPEICHTRDATIDVLGEVSLHGARIDGIDQGGRRRLLPGPHLCVDDGHVGKRPPRELLEQGGVQMRDFDLRLDDAAGAGPAESRPPLEEEEQPHHREDHYWE